MAQTSLLLPLVLCCIIMPAFVAASQSDEKKPPVWPFGFSIAASFPPPYHPCPSGSIHEHDTWLYYNWTIRAQRLDHTAGHHECVKHYNTSEPCTLINRGHDMWVIIPNKRICCRDMRLGMVKPTWLEKFHFVENQDMCGYPTAHWKKPEFGGMWYAEYWQTTTPDRSPLRWSPGDRKDQWIFDPSTYRIEEQDASLFSLPDYCTYECPPFH
eukprot:gnl/Trimastix_PCT/389.p1 GENE.gnl/Trimastix_PCT/389~~gnl/Trimastix_PCT/389.p1  ORF type:complete len:212 (+),score=42.32 gnl/Trimastix_PCT/389:87-722(+)